MKPAFLLSLALLLPACGGSRFFTYYKAHESRLVAEQLGAPPFPAPGKILGVMNGNPDTAIDIAVNGYLERFGLCRRDPPHYIRFLNQTGEVAKYTVTATVKEMISGRILREEKRTIKVYPTDATRETWTVY